MAISNWCVTIQLGHCLDKIDEKHGDSDALEEAGVRYLMDLKLVHGNVQYSCWQVERGAGSDTGAGRVHVQGYVELKRGRNLEWCKQQIHDGHWKQRFGTQAQAIAYCKKDDTRVEGGGPHEYGEPKAQGKRNDLVKVAEMVKSGASFEAILDECPNEALKYTGNIQKVQFMVQKNRTEAPYVAWYHGVTGTGKTTKIFETHGYDKVYIKDNSKWWDGYDQNKHEAILFDEFNWMEWKHEEILKILDKFPYQGQTKGGFVKINSPFIYFTSNYDPLTNCMPTWLTPAVKRRVHAWVEKTVVKLEHAAVQGLTRETAIEL